MSNKAKPSAIAAYLLDRLPNSVTHSILSDDSFCAKLEIVATSVITLTEGFRFDKELLYGAVRRALSGELAVCIDNTDGNNCSIIFENVERPRVVIEKGLQRLLHPLLVLIGADADTRQRALKGCADEIGFTQDKLEKWLELVRLAELTPSQMDVLGEDVAAAPLGFLERLEESITSGHFSVEDIVPQNPAHYDQLLFGNFDSTATFEELANEILPETMAESFSSDLKMLPFALAIAAIHILVPTRALSAVDDNRLTQELATLTRLDPFSAIAVLTICIQRCNSNSDYEPLARRFIDELIGNVETLKAQCGLFSGLYALSLSNLGRTVFREKPVQLKRLAAFAHASLCTRVISQTNIPLSDFMSWCFDVEGAGFVWSTLVDKRDAPRWRPEWLDPDQIVDEIFGRLRHLEFENLNAFTEVGLSDKIKIFGDQLKGRPAWTAFYPGPLEGIAISREGTWELSEENIAIVRADIEKAVGIKKCIGIISISPVANIPNALVDEATKELDRSAIPNGESDRAEFNAVLTGLAHIAGIKRSIPLAELVASLSLRATTAKPTIFRYNDVLPAILESAAAFEDRRKQIEWIAAMLLKLAYAANDKVDARFLATIIGTLNRYGDDLAMWLSRALSVSNAFAESVA